MPEPLRFHVEEETFKIYNRLLPTSSYLWDSDRIITIKNPVLLSYHISPLSVSSLKCYILQKITLFFKKKEKTSTAQNRRFFVVLRVIMFLFSIPLDILMWLEMQFEKKNAPNGIEPYNSESV